MIETQLDPRQAMVACLAQWREGIVGCDDAGLRDQVRALESVSRMLHSVMLAAVAELDSRNIAAATGFGSTKRLLAGMLHLSATEAGTRVTHATALAPRRALGGEVLPPTLPNTAAALAAGEIGPAQVRVISETMNAIPTSVSSTDREAAEADLAHYARSFDPRSLHKIGRHLLAHLNPDGPRPRDEPEPAPAAGELRFRDRHDGRLGFEGFLEPEHSAAFRALIEQFAAPRPAAEGIPDPRTTPQRNADALLEICGLARAAQDCPTTGGEPPHLTVTIDWDALRSGLGAATLDYGTPLSASERLGGGPVMRKSSPSSWVGHPNPSMSGGPCGPCRCPFAGRSWHGIVGALFRAATDHRECAKLTTVDTGSTAATPVWGTVFFYARPIIAMCTAPAGRSSSTPTTSTSSPQPFWTRRADHSATHSAAKKRDPRQ